MIEIPSGSMYDDGRYKVDMTAEIKLMFARKFKEWTPVVILKIRYCPDKNYFKSVGDLVLWYSHKESDSYSEAFARIGLVAMELLVSIHIYFRSDSQMD